MPLTHVLVRGFPNSKLMTGHLRTGQCDDETVPYLQEARASALPPLLHQLPYRTRVEAFLTMELERLLKPT